MTASNHDLDVWSRYPGGSAAAPDSPEGMAFDLWAADLLSSTRAGREHPALAVAVADYDVLLDSGRLTVDTWADVMRNYMAEMRRRANQEVERS